MLRPGNRLRFHTAASIRRNRPMRTVENCARYDRSRLRNPSDFTDGQWMLAEVHIPHAKRSSNKHTVDVRHGTSGSMYGRSTGCQQRAIPRDLPLRSTIKFYVTIGSMTARWTGCTMRCRCAAAGRCPARPVRRRPLSTARMSRALKNEEPDRCAWIRWRLEDQGQKSSCRRRLSVPPASPQIGRFKIPHFSFRLLADLRAVG